MQNLLEAKDSAIAKLREFTAKIAELVAPALEMEVETDSEHSTALTLGKNLAQLERDIEDKRKELKQPGLDYCRDVDDMAKYVSADIIKGKNHLRTKLNIFNQKKQAQIEEERKKREEEQRKQREELEKKKREELEKARKLVEEQEAVAKEAAELFGEKAPIQTQSVAIKRLEMKYAQEEKQLEKQIKTDNKTLENEAPKNFRTVWKFRIVDRNKIPINLMMPDESEIKKFVDAHKGQLTIPGIEIYSEQITVLK